MAAVSSFAAELLLLYQRAAQETITLNLGDRKKAVNMRHRLHTLRAAMRKEKHPLTIMANGVQFRVTTNGDLICEPVDASFLDVIAKAGVKVPDAPIPGIPSPVHSAPVPAANPGALSNFSEDGQDGNVQQVLSHFFKPKT